MNIYQWYNSLTLPSIVKDCMDNVKFMAGDDTYILIPPDHKKFDIKVAVRSESDVLRCTVLAQDPDGIWLDTDCEIINKFTPPKDGLPYFSQGMIGKANGDVIICNGATKVFKDILADFDKLPESGKNPGWLQAWCRVNKDKIRLIPQGYYRHFCLCHTSHLSDGQTMSVNGAVLQMVKGELVVVHRS
jgi:hypothetical protein